MKAKKLLAAAVLALTLGVTSCGKFTQNYADKINEAAKSESKKDDLTLKQVKKALGEGSGLLVAESGVLVFTKDEKKVTKTITVTFVSGVATLAVYAEVEKSSNK